MKDYIILDIESPNTYKYSVSAIGIVIIRNNKNIATKYSLINPEDNFEKDIIDMTGITPEMVKDSPKFYEYWPEISELLSNYPIIGHNITYDLSVITRTLKRYGIEVPDFEYLCTLELSRKYLDLNSYRLTDVMSYLNVNYDAHNALEDAKVTYTLFKHLRKYYRPTLLDTKKFYLKSNDKKEINEELTVIINGLYGMLSEIKYKNNMTSDVKKLLMEWIEDNKNKRDIQQINNIIKKIEYVINKDKLNKKDLNKISNIASPISKSNKYSKKELNSQVLDGIIEMMNTNTYVNSKEYNYLEKFMNYYDLPENVDKEAILNSFVVKD